MKYISIFFLLATFGLFSQTNSFSEKNAVYISAGHPTLWDMGNRENRFGINLGYQRNLGKSFVLDVFLSRASGNSTVSYFEDADELKRRLGPIGADVGLFEPGKIEIYAAGIKAYFAFINKQRHFFGASAGIGYYTSESLTQDITSFSFDIETNEIIDLDTEIRQETVDEAFLNLGLSYYYRWKYGLNIGVDVHSLSDISSRILFTEPILANHIFVGLLIGKRF
ncbi:hypothetical protein [Costertonia aggregata]|uniref:Outer membrane beta-barrel protein n=1 Tax=Costertonia aggregata TaxID=343403 RepID=A0A7H9APB8_9FLAO|nr:hypothetical protein [Costertonia aggregata]QLG45115.1 hypothetical protein HYG79_07045 [Costertonia aggregata]